MAKKTNKKETLTVTRFINEVLIDKFKIPYKKIVNDTCFIKYTGSKRPDLLISEMEYDVNKNDDEFIQNLLAYAEAKDDCVVGDKEWVDAYRQGIEKSKRLNIPYFIVTNCKVSYFYNSNTGEELKLNGNPIREFQPVHVLRLIKNNLKRNPSLIDISTGIDTQTTISEFTFNKKLWELANIYRGIDFKNITEKIDFTIGFIALKFFEEKAVQLNLKNETIDYWSDLLNYINRLPVFKTNFIGYILRLETETNFQEFKDLMELIHRKIVLNEITTEDIRDIYLIVHSMGELHKSGFDLFGAVYEMFASSKEKGDFGEFFTRRHYTHVFSKILLKSETVFNKDRKFKLLDPACGTGGFLTEAFKVLINNYRSSGTIDEGLEFVQNDCIFGYDVKSENISRTKLNMFLVGDGHTNIEKKDSLKDDLDFGSFDYIATNPPMGNGTVKAETNAISTIRYEIAFLSRIIKLLRVGGRACVILPDGFFESPTLWKFRREVMEKCTIDAIVSLPKYAFAPYTKEKTYALFIRKRSNKITKIQSEDIWMYIIDNDGYANSDKRFLTKLEKEDGSWLHDEISGWVGITGVEHIGLLEERWMKFDDSLTGGTEWIDDKGNELKLRKGGFISFKEINNTNYYNLLPESYLRPYEPNYISIDELARETGELLKLFNGIMGC